MAYNFSHIKPGVKIKIKNKVIVLINRKIQEMKGIIHCFEIDMNKMYNKIFEVKRVGVTGLVETVEYPGEWIYPDDIAKIVK